MATSENTLYRFGVFELDQKTGELRKAGRRINLQPQPFQVLVLLAGHVGELVTREEIQQQIWGDGTFVDFERGLNFAINRIRTVLNDDARTPHFIETIPRRGYRFVGPVNAQTGEAAHSTEKSSLLGRSTRSVRLGQVRSLAVLPLKDLSDQAEDYFAAAMTDTLVTELAQIRALRVISRTSVMQYQQAPKPLPHIAHELGVDAIVMGSVQRAGDRVRISAQLIHAETETHLWARSYERPLNDVLMLQREVAVTIATELKVRLGIHERRRFSRGNPVSREAQEAYLRGIYHFDRLELDRGMQLFQQAVTLDPSHAAAYGRLARGYWYLLFFNFLTPKNGFILLNEAVDHTLALDPESAEAYGYRAQGKLYYEWNWAGAEADFRRALDLNPNHAELRHFFGHFLMVVNQGDQGLAECRRAVERDPLGLILTACLGWHCLFSREFGAAVEPTLRALRMDPQFFWAHLILGWAYQQQGRLDEAIASYRMAVTTSAGAPLAISALVHALGTAGQVKEAQQLRLDLERRARTTYVSAYDVAAMNVGLGDHDAAFAALHRAVNEHASFLIHIEWDPRFDPLRVDPRFVELLHRIGLPRVVNPPTAIVCGDAIKTTAGRDGQPAILIDGPAS